MNDLILDAVYGDEIKKLRLKRINASFEIYDIELDGIFQGCIWTTNDNHWENSIRDYSDLQMIDIKIIIRELKKHRQNEFNKLPSV